MNGTKPAYMNEINAVRGVHRKYRHRFLDIAMSFWSAKVNRSLHYDIHDFQMSGGTEQSGGASRSFRLQRADHSL
jgi:hypothetical protein